MPVPESLAERTLCWNRPWGPGGEEERVHPWRDRPAESGRVRRRSRRAAASRGSSRCRRGWRSPCCPDDRSASSPGSGEPAENDVPRKGAESVSGASALATQTGARAEGRTHKVSRVAVHFLGLVNSERLRVVEGGEGQSAERADRTPRAAAAKR